VSSLCRDSATANPTESAKTARALIGFISVLQSSLDVIDSNMQNDT